MCLYTKYIENPKYKPNKKNGFNPPKCEDMRLMYVPVKCNKCIECRKQKRREWLVRLSEEIRNDSNCKFVTLTFNDEEYFKIRKKIDELWDNHYVIENEICTYAMRHFLELIRKHTKKSVKHWFITEKGEDFGRIHMHGIIWASDELIAKWKYGYYYIGTFVNEKTINYITKYMLKINEKYRDFEGKILCSAGIGGGYLKRYDAQMNKYKEDGTNETYRTRSGMKFNLPIYYRNKIYSDNEKEMLWIEKQERGYRYIMGEKVSVDNEEQYKAILQKYQELGKEVFKDNPENWEIEKQIKKLKHMRKYRKSYQQSKKVINKLSTGY